MEKDKAKQLGTKLKAARQAKHISVLELSRRVNVNDATIWRIEKGEFGAPKPNILAKLANELDLPVSDVFAIVGYVAPTQLPSFTPYLRAKYQDLPPDAMAELEASFARIAKRHGYDPNGAAPGEDEA